MTRRARFVLPVVLGAAVVASGAHLVAFSSPDRPVAPRAVCEPPVAGWARCVVPSPGVPAVVLVQAFEDGSARVVALDPDSGGGGR